MNLLARILSHGFAIAIVLLLAVGLIYWGELFPDWELPEVLSLGTPTERGATGTDDSITPDAPAVEPAAETATPPVTGETVPAILEAAEPAAVTETPGAIPAEEPATPEEPVAPEVTEDSAGITTGKPVIVPEAVAPETTAPAAEITGEAAEPVTTAASAADMTETAAREPAELPEAVAASEVPTAEPEEEIAPSLPEPFVTPGASAPVPATAESAAAAEPESAILKMTSSAADAEIPAADTASAAAVTTPTDDEAAPAETAAVITEPLQAPPPAVGEQPIQPPADPVAPVAIESQPESMADDETRVPVPGSLEPAAASSYELLAAAREAFWLRDYETAENKYRQLIVMEPDNPDGYGELGNMYFSQGKWEQAATAYFDAGTRLVAEGQLEQASQLVEVIRGLDGSQADELNELITAAQAASH